MKNIYKIDKLAYTNSNKIIAIDESMFTHIENSQQWVVGLINLSSKQIRIEFLNDRSEDTLKKIIELHINKGNIINRDLWPGYNFLDLNNSG